MNSEIIGKVSVTEKSPASCDAFAFWLDSRVRISPFDIVKVANNSGGIKSTTYGIVEDIFHITDSPSHLSNFVSSDFGALDLSEELTKKLSLSYAKVSVIHNDKDNYMPVFDGTPVYTTDENDIIIALGLDNVPPHKRIPAGLLKTSTGVCVPVMFNSDFLIGPEGAHLNISGISGLATKTSYVMFLLKAIQYTLKDTAVIVINVKSDDLLRLHVRNPKLTDEQQAQWEPLGIPCKPFSGVKYFYAFQSKSLSNNKYCANTALAAEDVEEQFKAGIAHNYVFTYDHDKESIELLFSNIDDPGQTMESIINYILNSAEFEELTWEGFKDAVRSYVESGTKTSKMNKEITVQSWRKFSRLINNAINNPVFQSALSGERELHHVHLSDEISNITTGDTFVVDIAKLNEQLQCLVFGDVIKAVYAIKQGDLRLRNTTKDIPRRIIIFVDELNKYAPSTSPKTSPILSDLLEITERGRHEGIILFAAEQFRSAVHDRIKGNCSTHVYGRTNAIEISKADYKYIPNVFSNMMNRLDKGDLIIQHPILKTVLRISFPHPCYHQGGEKDE